MRYVFFRGKVVREGVEPLPSQYGDRDGMLPDAFHPLARKHKKLAAKEGKAAFPFADLWHCDS